MNINNSTDSIPHRQNPKSSTLSTPDGCAAFSPASTRAASPTVRQAEDSRPRSIKFQSLPQIAVSDAEIGSTESKTAKSLFAKLAALDGESEPTSLASHVMRSWVSGLHLSRLTPGLSRQISYRISAALLQTTATMVHRPKLQSRPSVITANFVQRPTSSPPPLLPSLTLPSPATPLNTLIKGINVLSQ